MTSKNKYDIFLSFSGEKSRLFSQKLKDLIEKELDLGSVFFSEENIKAGDKWIENIYEAIDSAKLGIFSFSEENKRNPWLFLEYGALTYKKHNRKNKTLEVIPLFLDFIDNDWSDNAITDIKSLSLIDNKKHENLEKIICELIARVNDVTHNYETSDAVIEEFKNLDNKESFLNEVEAIIKPNKSNPIEESSKESARGSTYPANIQSYDCYNNSDIDVSIKVLNIINDMIEKKGTCNIHKKMEYDIIEQTLKNKNFKDETIRIAINYLKNENCIEIFHLENRYSYPVEHIKITLEGEKTIRRRNRLLNKDGF